MLPHFLVYFGIAILISAAGCFSSVESLADEPHKTGAQSRSPASAPAEFADGRKTVATVESANVPIELLSVFKLLNELGRDQVKGTRFVKATFICSERPEDEFSEDAWLLNEDDSTVTLLKEDLIPWIYNKKAATTIPSSWHPKVVQLKSVIDADFESLCATMSRPEAAPVDDTEGLRGTTRSMNGKGLTYRLLVAHAAWVNGLPQYCEPIVSLNSGFEESRSEYVTSVLDDLGWRHFLRGVNLLMYADRREVLPHLKISSRLEWKTEFGLDVDELTQQIERLVSETQNQPQEDIDESRLSIAEKAKLYLSQLKDQHGRQMGQPGGVHIYHSYGKDIETPTPLPAQKLKDLGIAVIPFLIKALEDDTPTRTIWHWRDFHKNREVWRVSDMAAAILQDLSVGNFSTRFSVTIGSHHSSIPFSQGDPKDRKLAITDFLRWYDKNKDLSEDDRMFGHFSTDHPNNWLTAGTYFLKKHDARAVEPLLERIPRSGSFRKGDLCELVARFGDPKAIPVLLEVLKSSDEPADRLSAANALWELGDPSGVAVAIEYMSEAKQSYGSWYTPTWFLIKSHAKDGIETLRSIIIEGPVDRSVEVLKFIESSLTGDILGSDIERTGCVEICPLLVASMDRTEYTGGSLNDIKIRSKDLAAKGFAAMIQESDSQVSDGDYSIDPKLFNELEPDESKRDKQIESLKQWYQENKDRLIWDSKAKRLVVKE